MQVPDAAVAWSTMMGCSTSIGSCLSSTSLRPLDGAGRGAEVGPAASSRALSYIGLVACACSMLCFCFFIRSSSIMRFVMSLMSTSVCASLSSWT